MIALGIAVAACAVALAVWDTFRRALAAQVRLGELRVEAKRGEDLVALQKRIEVNDGEVMKLRAEVASLTSAITVKGIGGRRG